MSLPLYVNWIFFGQYSQKCERKCYFKSIFVSLASSLTKIRILTNQVRHSSRGNDQRRNFPPDTRIFADRGPWPVGLGPETIEIDSPHSDFVEVLEHVTNSATQCQTRLSVNKMKSVMLIRLTVVKHQAPNLCNMKTLSRRRVR